VPGREREREREKEREREGGREHGALQYRKVQVVFTETKNIRSVKNELVSSGLGKCN